MDIHAWAMDMGRPRISMDSPWKYSVSGWDKGRDRGPTILHSLFNLLKFHSDTAKSRFNDRWEVRGQFGGAQGSIKGHFGQEFG